MGQLRAVLRDLASPLLARYEYHLKPSARDPLGGPLNGQRHRQRIFMDLASEFRFAAIVETGTFKGSSTEFMAGQLDAPIHTAEARPRFFHYARLRLRPFPRVKVALTDSRSLLRRLAADPSFPKQNVFFYLDAHWYEDLPLRDEVEIVSATWKDSVIMVDDFQVPGDDGYRFDDYGAGKRLDLSYLHPLDRFGLTAFFPTAPSGEETGAKRGCVVLAQGSAVAERVAKLGSLRRHG